MSQQTYTGQCPQCIHPMHYGPCTGLYMYDRPGGYPGNQQCLCGHPFVQQTITVTPDPRDAQISALQAQIKRLTADLAICRQHDSGMVDSAEGLHVLLSRIEQACDALKRENAELRQALQRALRDLELCVVGHSDPVKKAAREALDAARKEQG